MKRLDLILTLCLCVLAGKAFGELMFEQQEIIHRATIEEDKFEADFRFTITGSKTVVIDKVVSSCGCTIPKLDKRKYLPDENGIISAVFNYGSRTGMQRKQITVHSSEGSIYTLSLVVDIPKFISIQPVILKWSIGEPIQSRSAVVSVADPELIKLSLPDKPSGVFDTRLQESTGGQYTILVKPRSTAVRATEFFPVRAVILKGQQEITRQVGFHCLIR